MNKNVTKYITQGMYVLTTKKGGCVVDAVMLISMADAPVVAISVSKTNYTCNLVKEAPLYGLSILPIGTDPKIIETFGMHSMETYNKFEHVELVNVLDVPVLKNCLGYMVFEQIDEIDADDHVIYMGRMKAGEIVEADKKPMSYAYYQSDVKAEVMKLLNKEPKKDEEPKTKWICTVCGYVYVGDEMPDDFICPLCGVGKEYFKKVEE